MEVAVPKEQQQPKPNSQNMVIQGKKGLMGLLDIVKQIDNYPSKNDRKEVTNQRKMPFKNQGHK
jgi:hypothetical protein